MEQYLDVSRHQGRFDPAKARAAGVDGVFLRHAYGEAPDTAALGWAGACKAAGLTVAGYGFATWHYKRENGGSPERARAVMQRQVAAWVKAAAQSGCTGWFAIDQELEPGQQMTLDKTRNTRILNEAAALLRRAGLHPCVYCSVSWDSRYICTADLTAPYWLARYYDGRADFGTPWADLACLPDDKATRWMRQLHGAGRLAGWQFASTGLGEKYGAASPGIDRSVFYFQPAAPALWYGRFGPADAAALAALEARLAGLGLAAHRAGDTLTTGAGLSPGDKAALQAAADGLGVAVCWQAEPFAPAPAGYTVLQVGLVVQGSFATRQEASRWLAAQLPAAWPAPEGKEISQ